MVVTPVFSSHSGDPRINIFFAGVILEPATETATSPSTAKSDGFNVILEPATETATSSSTAKSDGFND